MKSFPGIRWLPRPHSVRFRAGCLKLPSQPVVLISAPAGILAPLIEQEWQTEFGGVRVADGSQNGFSFKIGEGAGARPSLPPPPDKPEHYRLRIGAQGVAVSASDYRGLLYAWQTLKQVLRECPDGLPFMSVSDGPDIPWRVYHLDLKGTRRTRENLFQILPRLSELRINALLIEYEDYLRLSRHPDLAVEAALDGNFVRQWLVALDKYGVSAIPLVQTLGHWQYVLMNPAYAQLREHPDVTSDGCPLHPGTWELVRDFLDEILELHPNAPFIHIGLDETALLGKCPKCREHLGVRPPIALHIEWLNKVAAYVSSRGFTPMAWCDKMLSEIDGLHEAELQKIDPSIVLLGWDYHSSGPVTRSLMFNHRHYVSEHWLQRPQEGLDQMPSLHFGPNSEVLENLPPDVYSRLKKRFSDSETPDSIRTFSDSERLREMGYEMFGAAGLRVSYHGALSPQFMRAQFNAMAWAEGARRMKFQGVIGTSWSRGHSWAATNAHPELDWFTVASLGEACWSGLASKDLPDFDRRFAFQFFGLPDGAIGEAYGLFRRTPARADHVMDNYSARVEKLLESLRPLVKRNQDAFDIFLTVSSLQRFLLSLDFCLLEGAYFTAIWEKVPPAFKQKMQDNFRQRLEEAGARCAELKRIYRRHLVEADADELAETQLRFLIQQVTDLMKRLFP